MNPYYKDDNVEIYNCDFRELDVTPQLLIADPPFDIWGKVIESISVIPYISAALFTNWQNRDSLSLLGKPRAEIVWTFADGRWVSHKLPRITHETILIYGETYDAYVGRDMSDRIPEDKGRGSVGKDKMPERTWIPRERALLDSYFHHSRNVSTGVWSKPLPLISRLIEWLSSPNELVYDPFMGRGSALIASKSLNRKYIGCDIDEKMCEYSVTRYLGETT